jgi:hypothetical protein
MSDADYWLFIDDLRDPPSDKWVSTAPRGIQTYGEW